MRAYPILINNHLRSTSCSTTTPSLSLSTQGFQLSSSRSSIDQFAKYTTPPSPPPTPALPKTVANLSRRSISPGSDLSSSPPATKEMHCRVPIFVKILREFVNICHLKINDGDQSVNSVFHGRRSFLFFISGPL